MKKFKFKENTERRGYAANILDIWCQGDKIVTYVQGTYIYKIEISKTWKPIRYGAEWK